MASIGGVILTDLKTAIAVDHSALNPAGTYDLSAAGAVEIGNHMQHPGSTQAFVFLTPDLFPSRAKAVSLNRYGRDIVILMGGFVAGADSAEARILAAIELMHDVWSAIENDVRTAGGTLRARNDMIDVLNQGTAFNGDEINIPGMGVFSSTCTVTYQTSRGI